MKRMHTALVVALFSGSGVVMSAQSPTTTPIWSPTLEVRVVAASPSGDTTTTSETSALPLNGQAVTFFASSSADLCTSGGGRIDSAAFAQRTDNLLKLSASFKSSDSQGIRVLVESHFETFAGGAAPPRSSQVITFKEGEDVTLETLRPTTEGPCHRRNLSIKARVHLRANSPAAQTARYTADVWLVHTDPVGQERRQHVTMTLDASGPMPFSFDPLSFALPQISPNQGDLEAFIQLRGSLRARVRPDGNIDLEVSTLRPFGVRAPSDPIGAPRPGAEGHKSLSVRDDETIAVDVPMPNGFLTHALTPGARFDVTAGGVRAAGSGAGATRTTAAQTGNAVEVTNDRMTIRSGLFFKDHKTQLLIRLRKTRD